MYIGAENVGKLVKDSDATVALPLAIMLQMVHSLFYTIILSTIILWECAQCVHVHSLYYVPHIVYKYDALYLFILYVASRIDSLT